MRVGLVPWDAAPADPTQLLNPEVSAAARNVALRIVIIDNMTAPDRPLAAELIEFRGVGMPNKKVIFVAFAIEDERQRDFLKGQSLHPRAPFEFIDMSVKEPYSSNWKDRVRTRIRRSHGVIVLVSKNSLKSSGQKWEIQCAKDERKPIRGIWAYKDDRTTITGVTTVTWSDTNIINFIDSL